MPLPPLTQHPLPSSTPIYDSSFPSLVNKVDRVERRLKVFILVAAGIGVVFEAAAIKNLREQRSAAESNREAICRLNEQVANLQKVISSK